MFCAAWGQKLNRGIREWRGNEQHRAPIDPHVAVWEPAVKSAAAECPRKWLPSGLTATTWRSETAERWPLLHGATGRISRLSVLCAALAVFCVTSIGCEGEAQKRVIEQRIG